MKFIFKIILILLMVPLAAGLGFMWRRYCPSVDRVTAIIGGVRHPLSAERCPNGLIRISVPSNFNSGVLVDRANQKVLVPGTSDFYSVIGLVFSRDLEPTGVSFDNRIKIERDTELRFFEGGFSFRDFKTGYAVIVEFNDL